MDKPCNNCEINHICVKVFDKGCVERAKWYHYIGLALIPENIDLIKDYGLMTKEQQIRKFYEH